MTVLFSCLVCLFIGWKLGRKYSDFQDIMLARRVAKLVQQRDQVSQEQEDYARWEKQDKRIKKVMDDSDRGELAQ